MDRHSGGLDRLGFTADYAGTSLIGLHDTEERLVEQAVQRLSVPDPLYELSELDVLFDQEKSALWSFMNPVGRSSFTPSLLRDFESWQGLISSAFGPDKVPLRYLVLGSRTPGVFCFGGDLELFELLIRSGDRQGLTTYGNRCVAILERNLRSLDLPILTIGLVQGQALGGGFEALLSFDFLVAERQSMFGLPETMFGLFPGMGAHAILTRKIGAAMADRLIHSSETYTAEQMYDLGIVTHLAEPGQGVAVVREFIHKSDRRHGGLVRSRRASKLASPLALDELQAIVGEWVNAALDLSEQDLRLMRRLVSAQEKLPKASQAA
jgi:DSF synthase